MLNWTISALSVLIYCGLQWNGIPVIYFHQATGSSRSICDLVVDAGPDTSVCAPGGSIMLEGAITGDPLFYQWTPSTGLSNAFVLNPTASITGSITYTLVAYAVDPANPSLIVNGDFSAGNTGFNSDYNYVVDIPGPQNEMVPEGTYAVIPNPNSVHNGFTGCNDHTGGGGNMMVINGAANLQDIWCQTISVSPNTFYNVSAWVASVNPASPAELQFSINDVPIGPIINAVSTPCVWIPFNAVWNSGSSTTAEICILNLNTATGGNDFALDDISMVGLCSAEDEVTISLYDEVAPQPSIDGPAFLCEGEIGIYTASFPPDPPIYTYQWIVPSGASIISGQGTPQVTILWEDAQEDEICLEIETRCDMNEGCFEVLVGTLPDVPLISGPTAICPGETANFYTSEQDPDDIYIWTFPSNVAIISGQGTNEIELEWVAEGEAEICISITNACGTTINCAYLTLLPGYQVQFDTTICEGTTFELNGTTYGNGLYSGIEYFLTEAGCDSIVQVEVTEATALEYWFIESLCPGDSIFLEGAYQTAAGIYTDAYITVSGCDSLVITEVIISPVDSTLLFFTSCNPADTGITTIIFSQGNCDSIVITQIDLLPTDTTIISLFSCSSADTGQTTLLLTNQYGCDSLIVTSTYLWPTDTTDIYLTTCDPAQVGITQDMLMNIYGCDSLVVTEVSYLQSDTTRLSELSCFLSDTGTTSTLLLNSNGCDSLVIVTTTYAGSDTTFISSTTCSPVDSGLVISTLLNQFGCDSVISSYTTFLYSDTTYLSSSTCEVLDTGTFLQLLTNTEGCDSLVVETVTLNSIHLCDLTSSISTTQPLCDGDSAVIVITTSIGLEPFSIGWRHATSPLSGNGIIATNPGAFTTTLALPGAYYFEIQSANGISVFDTIQIDDIPPLTIAAIAQTDMFGYQIRCAGDSTGMASVEIIQTGTPPYVYNWSEGSSTPEIALLSAGNYSITVTDDHGCTATSSVTLTEPQPMQYNILIDEINCFGEENGGIMVINIQGGVLPWLTAIDQGPLLPILAYTDLNAGNHILDIQDQNGCSFRETFILDEPEYWYLDLGPDTIVPYGTPYVLHARLYGQPMGMVSYEWPDGQCVDCSSRTIELFNDTAFDVIATDDNGCSSRDQILIDVFIDRNLYVPNIFSPNGDQINDEFSISSSSGVKEIEELSIFDRWGNLVFQAFHFQPDDPTSSWDGRMNDQPMNPGVYVYKLKVLFQDNKQEIRFGDVTLVR